MAEWVWTSLYILTINVGLSNGGCEASATAMISAWGMGTCSMEEGGIFLLLK